MGRRYHTPYAEQRSGFIYLIYSEAAHLAKIGFSDNVERRLAALQAGSPVKLRTVAWFKAIHRDERRLHLTFDAERQHGEWFRPTRSIALAFRRLSRMRGGTVDWLALSHWPNQRKSLALGCPQCGYQLGYSSQLVEVAGEIAS